MDSSPPALAGSAVSRWRWPLLSLALCLAALGLLYRDTVVSMVGIWARSETFAHCYLVAPISLWLVWRRRAHVAVLQPRPQPLFVLPMLVLAFGWLVADLASVNAGTQLMLVGLLVLTVPAVLGWPVARELAFPLAFLFFMVPIGEFMLDPMMKWTADFTVAAVRLSGIPVYREGLQFVIPSGTWSVVEACSGVRYLIASFMVGSLFAYLNYNSTRKRLLFCLVSLAVPVVANWLRAYLIVMLGHLSGNELAVGADHLVYGWVFFGIVIGVMFFVGARWTDPEPAAPSVGAAGGTHAAQPARPAWGGAVLVGLVLVLPHAAQLALSDGPPPAQPPVLKAPALQGLALAPEGAAPALEPVFVNADAQLAAAYQLPDRIVGLHLAYYRAQRYGAKLVSSDNVLVRSESSQWQITGVDARAADASAVAWRRSELLAGSVSAAGGERTRVEVRQVYWIDGTLTASAVRAKLHAVRARLLGRGDAGAMITVYAVGDAARTQALLDDFTRQHLPAIERHLHTYRAAFAPR